MKKLEDISLFLLDMDGTIYLDYTLIDGASDFIDTLRKKGKHYIFLTNNSSRNINDYVSKMRFLNIPCTDENMFTSGMAMGLFLSNNRRGKKVYLVGTTSLHKELLSYGIELVEEDPDIVVIGYDKELNYKKLEKACLFLDNGAEFLATNPDLVCPIEDGRYLPDCGSFCMMLTNATKKTPKYIGKPESYMVDLLVKELNIPYENIAIVGDRMYTDIKTGINANITSILVLSGETTKVMLEDSPYKPTYTYPSVKEIIKDL